MRKISRVLDKLQDCSDFICFVQALIVDHQARKSNVTIEEHYHTEHDAVKSTQQRLDRVLQNSLWAALKSI